MLYVISCIEGGEEGRRRRCLKFGEVFIIVKLMFIRGYFSFYYFFIV